MSNDIRNMYYSFVIQSIHTPVMWITWLGKCIKNKEFVIFAFLCFVFNAMYSQQLESYIQEAITNNPRIQSFELRYAIAKEKVNEGYTLPDTQLSVGYFVSEPETRTGAQRAKFSIQQMLPWFGTITAREHYIDAIAEKEYTEVSIAKRKLALDVALSYYQLFTIYAKQKILSDNINLLKTYEQLALTSVETGQASALDVLRLQIRQNELQEQNHVLQEIFMAEQTNFFNTLLNKDIGTIIVPDEMKIPEEEVYIDKDKLSLNPEILKYDTWYESIVQSEALNKKESRPKLGVGLSYIPVSERQDMAVTDNGKDIIMPMVSLSIPVFTSRYSSITRQNELHQERILAEKEEKIQQLEKLLANAMALAQAARIQNNTQQKNLEQAKNAEQILLKSYETGTIDFNDVLDIQELQLKFQLKRVESIKQYYTETAKIHYLTN